jgi:LuxR family quorum-sensing system transcriptional regulator SolR
MGENQELFAGIAAASTSLELKRMLRRAVQMHGMEYFQLLRFKHRQFVDSPWIDMPTALPMALAKGAAGTMNTADPVAVRGLDRDLPFWWDEGDFAAKGDDAVRAHIAKAKAAGIGAALSIPLHGALGVCDVVHVGATARSVTDAEHGATALAVLSAAAYLCATRLRQIDRQAFGPAECEISLSARELEVLRWCKDGKSYSEIGTIIGISSKTVEFHIANVMRKLGVNQKIAAIMVAVRKGLIEI